MASAGLKLTINSDDPPMFGIDLAMEYCTLHHVMGFTPEELKEFALNGIDAAWVDDQTKSEWRTTWSDEIDELLAQFT
jgi:adenosine deaminase